ncbi:GH25 family lysozyme [Hespellia stercorisuis]|uniref:Lyzozyme M1 (1,4-beta-N-acetylmuramidase), GH25 family n=1 Tax=Hespellia stercorisuis DSM 15480 TaxID=1121950 RepID=A0A1M6RL80_9FIRM|nr:GH25 family lysozyme [Hespellia stercorisuis]SHK33107.1 Lyzozyme M1 (1,4-beta-N-acetylmuramidase), GH25 family [Hespellia stercorisuis DSM 15480]
MLNGIDIASYQAGIDLGAVPCDFAIIKATQGTSYVNPDCDRAFQNGVAAGKKLGVYHYAGGGGAVAEADFFIDQIQGYIGKAILVLDWEADQNPNFGNVAYAKEFMDRVTQKTGVKPMIYMSMSVTRQQDWSSLVAANYGLWVAQYPDYNKTGYQTEPWIDGEGTGAWPGYAMLQYTSSGCLANWGGCLDLDLFYGDTAAWDAYAGATSAPTKIEVKPKQIPGMAKNKVGLKYAGHVQDIGDCSVVRDGQVAGTTGFSKRLEAITVDVDVLRKVKGYENLKMNVLVHVQDIGDKTYENIKSTTVIGTKGEGRRLEGIEFEVTGLPTGRVLKFQVHEQDKGWSTIATASDIGAFRGSVGESRRIEAIKIWIDDKSEAR